MKEFPREKYTLKAYEGEKYALHVYSNKKNLVSNRVEYSDNWETLYEKSKKEAEKGSECEIWELKYEFFP